MSFTEKLKNTLKSTYDLDLIGIADAAALENEPKGHRPSDLLPDAKSIIVFGRSFSDGAFSGMFRAFEDKRGAAQSAYTSYCDDLAPNFLLVGDTFNITCYIEDTYGKTAVPCTFNVMQSMIPDNAPGKFFADPYGQGMPLDISKAALAAGLGEYGWSNRFLTPKYGPRQMLSAVITNLELEADAPYTGPSLCDPEKCGICAALCPTKAIPPYGPVNGKTVSAGAKKQLISDIKANSCAVASLALRKEFAGRAPVPDLVESYDPTNEELKAAFAKKPVNGGGMEHFPRSLCERCMLYCPAGSWKKHFKDTGLSTFDPDEYSQK